MTDATLPAHTKSSQRASILKILPLVSLPVIGMLLFVLGLSSGIRGTDLGILGLAIVTGLMGVVPLLLDQLRPLEKRHILLSLICIAYTLSFAVPVYTEYFLNDLQMTGMAGWAGIRGPDLLVAQVAALIGLIMFYIGYALPIGPILGNGLPRPRRDWPLFWCLGMALIMIPMGWSLFLAGQFRLIPARAGSGVLGAFASSFYFGIALLTLTWMRYRSRAALVMMIAAVPPTMAMAFLTGSKTLFLSPLMMIAFAFIVETRRIRPIWVIGGLLVIISIYPLAVFQREFLLQGGRFTAGDLIQNPAATLGLLSRFVASVDWGDYFVQGLQATGNRFNSLGITSIIMRDTPDRVPFQGGWTIGNIFVAYVPRVFWPGKPQIAIGQWITDTYGPGPHIKSYTAPSWIGEFYLNYGYAGIIVGMTVMGAYIRTIYEYLFRTHATIPIALAAVAALNALVISVEKALSAPINGVTFKLMPIVLAHMLWIALSGPSQRAAETPSEPPPGET